MGHGEALPAIRRDGSYALPSADRAKLETKQAYCAAVPNVHRERADTRAKALQQVEEMIATGERVGAAIAAVAEAHGIGKRSLCTYRGKIYKVARNADRASPEGDGAVF